MKIPVLSKEDITENNQIVLSEDRFTKTLITKKVNNFVEKTLDGFRNPLKAYFYLKALEETIKQIKANKDFDFSVKQEINRYSDVNNIAYGVKFQTVTRRSYSYDNQELKELEAKKAGIDAKIKAIQKYLQVIEEPTINSDTGELTQPAIVTTSEYIKSTFEKE